ncbi:MAG TPA: uracil-DNA glycosylase [Proteobacteria bacterium]|nr:uracil-DNA glycosylase [Pseudomonadota bacterium]
MSDWKVDLIEFVERFDLYLKQLQSRGIVSVPLKRSVEEFMKLVDSGEFFRLGASDRGMTLAEVQEILGNCTRCKLWQHRTNIVFGEGNPHAELMFVGEAPGQEEDLQARPFVGKAGKLLTQMIEAMGKSRSDVYIANVLKCRPPGNRNPEPDEIAACEPFLLMQIQIIRPKVVCALGNVAAQTLLKTRQGIGSLRGRFYNFMGAKLYPTFHPAYLLRNPKAKVDAWKDLKLVMRELGWPIPRRQR